LKDVGFNSHGYFVCNIDFAMYEQMNKWCY